MSTQNQVRDDMLASASSLSTDDVSKMHKWAIDEAERRKNDPDYHKCPRCYGYHMTRGNFDNLCDRCIEVILEHFPNHASVPFIMEAINKWGAKK